MNVPGRCSFVQSRLSPSVIPFCSGKVRSLSDSEEVAVNVHEKISSGVFVCGLRYSIRFFDPRVGILDAVRCRS